MAGVAVDEEIEAGEGAAGIDDDVGGDGDAPAFEECGESGVVGGVEEEEEATGAVEVGFEDLAFGGGEEAGGSGDDDGVGIGGDGGGFGEVEGAAIDMVAGDGAGDAGESVVFVAVVEVAFAMAGEGVDAGGPGLGEAEDGGGEGLFAAKGESVGESTAQHGCEVEFDEVGCGDDAAGFALLEDDEVGFVDPELGGEGFGAGDVAVGVDAFDADAAPGGVFVFFEEVDDVAVAFVAGLEEDEDIDAVGQAVEEVTGSLGEFVEALAADVGAEIVALGEVVDHEGEEGGEEKGGEAVEAVGPSSFAAKPHAVA